MTSKEFNKIIAEKDRIIEETKRAQSGSDKKYLETAIELKATKERLTQIESDLTKMPDQIARLNRIEEEYANRDRKRDIKQHAENSCRDRGIPLALIEGRTFESIDEVDDVLDLAADALEQKRIETVNESFSGLSKPKAGAAEPPTQAEQTKAALARYGLDADYINGNSS